MFYCDGFETLITALYFKGDPYLKSYIPLPASTELSLLPRPLADLLSPSAAATPCSGSRRR